jgi:MFS family permease
MGLLTTFFPLEADTTAGVGPERFGLIYALWGVLIAVFQIPVTRALARVRPVTAIASGYALMAVAFVPIALRPGLWGFVAAFTCLAFASILTAPATGTLVANLAPVQARARYQSMIGFDWSLGGIIAPLAAGLLYGRVAHSLFWLAAAVLALTPAPLLPLWRRRNLRVQEAEEIAYSRVRPTEAVSTP